MTAKELKAVLLKHDPALTMAVANEAALNKGHAYTVWDVKREERAYADDGTEQTLLAVAVHRFTRKRTEPFLSGLIKDLEAQGITVGDRYCQYEDDTKYWHFVFDLEVLGSFEEV